MRRAGAATRVGAAKSGRMPRYRRGLLEVWGRREAHLHAMAEPGTIPRVDSHNADLESKFHTQS